MVHVDPRVGPARPALRDPPRVTGPARPARVTRPRDRPRAACAVDEADAGQDRCKITKPPWPGRQPWRWEDGVEQPDLGSGFGGLGVVALTGTRPLGGVAAGLVVGVLAGG